jgi:hypothetical protein
MCLCSFSHHEYIINIYYSEVNIYKSKINIYLRRLPGMVGRTSMPSATAGEIKRAFPMEIGKALEVPA